MNKLRTDILLVEDNPDEAILTKHHLRNSGQELIHVRDGVEALDFIFGTGMFMGRDIAMPPKLVLLDINMPRVDGIEVLQKLRADDRTKFIPVLILVATATVPEVEKCTALGANGFIVKPVTFEKYTQALSKLGMR